MKLLFLILLGLAYISAENIGFTTNRPNTTEEQGTTEDQGLTLVTEKDINSTVRYTTIQPDSKLLRNSNLTFSSTSENDTISTELPTSTSTTTTTTTTTTTISKIRPVGPQSKVIRRFLYAIWHHYFLDDNSYYQSGDIGDISFNGLWIDRNLFLREDDVGYVIMPTWIDSVRCDKRYLVARWQRTSYLKNPVSLFAPADEWMGSDWRKMETFLCVTRRGECGADWELRKYNHGIQGNEDTNDLFYPSNPSQRSQMDLGYAGWSAYGSHICYIWKYKGDLPYFY